MRAKLKVNSIIEIIGTPKEYAEQVMGIVMDKLGERKDISIIKKEVAEAKKMDDKPFWTTFCDMQFEVESIDGLLTYCFDFLPSSVEIVEPTNFPMQNFDMNNLLNDVIAKLHEYHMALKNTQAENILLKRNIEKKEDKKNDVSTAK